MCIFFPKALYWRKHSLPFYPLKSGIYKWSCWLSNCSSQKHHRISSNLSRSLLYLVFCGIIYIYLNRILTYVRGKKKRRRLKKSLMWFARKIFLNKKVKKTLLCADASTSIPTLHRKGLTNQRWCQWHLKQAITFLSEWVLYTLNGNNSQSHQNYST